MAHNNTSTTEVDGVTLSNADFQTYRNLNPQERQAWLDAGKPTDLTNWYNNVLNKQPLSRAEAERTRLQGGTVADTDGDGQPDIVVDTGSGGGVSTTQSSGSSLGGSSTGGTSNASFQGYDSSQLEKSAEFKALSEDDQAAVRAVFDAIASNDEKKAQQLIQAFDAAAKINDPYFAQQFKIAADTIKRGFVSIDDDLAFKEQLESKRLSDLQEDIASKQDFLTLEETSALRGIERQYDQQLKDTRQSAAARGMTFSTRRAESEQLLGEVTGDLRESTQRQFGIQQLEASRTLDRGERDIAAETERLRQLAEEGKLDLFRQAEANLGTLNLPNLSGAPSPLGDITGAIPQEKLQNTLTSAQSFVF